MLLLIHLFILDFRAMFKMRKKSIYYFTIIFFVVIIILPFAQYIFKFTPETELVGFTKEASFPSLSIKSWYNKSFQKELEDYFDQNLGFKSFLIKTDNQFNFLLFNEIHQKTNSKIIVGENNYLFENNYIKSYIGRDYRDTEILEDRIKSLAELQDELMQLGKTFVFLIAPSKASFYSEHIPEELIYKTADADPLNNYKRILPLLNKYNINYIDGLEYLLDKKEKSQYPLFPKGGTHWTRYASCLVSNEVLSELDNIGYEPIDLLNCENVDIYHEPKDEDRDLIDLANLWSKKIFYEDLAYPKKSTSTESLNDINLLMIGDSFSWGIMHNLKNGKSLENYNLYYYFNSDYDMAGNMKPVSKDNTTLKEEILKQDLVIIESNEASLKDIGFGFIDAGFSALKHE